MSIFIPKGLFQIFIILCVGLWCRVCVWGVCAYVCGMMYVYGVCGMVCIVCGVCMCIVECVRVCKRYICVVCVYVCGW